MGKWANKNNIEKDQCTMVLNLDELGPVGETAENYKKYTVRHEAGHALGFDHEHQHPDLSTDIFNEDQIIDDNLQIINS